MTNKLEIHGMHCKSCVAIIKEAMEEAGAKNISIRLDEKKQTGIALFEGDKKKAADAVKKEGYKVQE